MEIEEIRFWMLSCWIGLFGSAIYSRMITEIRQIYYYFALGLETFFAITGLIFFIVHQNKKKVK